MDPERLKLLRTRLASGQAPAAAEPPGVLPQTVGFLKGLVSEPISDPMAAVKDFGSGAKTGALSMVEGGADLLDATGLTDFNYNPVATGGKSSWGSLGQGIGSFGTLAATAIPALTAGALGAPALAVGGMGLAGTAAGLGMSTGAGMNEAEQRALELGREATTRERIGGAAIGATEMLPVGRLMGPLVRGGRRASIGGQAAAEAAQEAGASAAQDVNVGQMPNIDQALTEGIIGGMVGGAAGGAGRMASRRPAPPEAGTPPPPAQAPPQITGRPNLQLPPPPPQLPPPGPEGPTRLGADGAGGIVAPPPNQFMQDAYARAAGQQERPRPPDMPPPPPTGQLGVGGTGVGGVMADPSYTPPQLPPPGPNPTTFMQDAYENARGRQETAGVQPEIPAGTLGLGPEGRGGLMTPPTYPPPAIFEGTPPPISQRPVVPPFEAPPASQPVPVPEPAPAPEPTAAPELPGEEEMFTPQQPLPPPAVQPPVQPPVPPEAAPPPPPPAPPKEKKEDEEDESKKKGEPAPVVEPDPAEEARASVRKFYSQRVYMRTMVEESAGQKTGTGAAKMQDAGWWDARINNLEAAAENVRKAGGTLERGHQWGVEVEGQQPGEGLAAGRKFVEKIRSREPSIADNIKRFLAGFGDTVPKGLKFTNRETTRTAGSYGLGRSKINMYPSSHTPNDLVLVHEMGHFIFTELMSHDDRIEFMKMAKEHYVGRPDRTRAERSKGANAAQNVQELFTWNLEKYYISRNPEAGAESYWRKVVKRFVQPVYDFVTGSRTTVFDPFFDRMLNEASSIRPSPDGMRPAAAAFANRHELGLTDEDFTVRGMKNQTLGARRGSTRAPPDTPAFKSWFKGSKVTDAKGNPQVVYHGTPEDFDVFDEGEEGYMFQAFFTNDTSVAEGYAGEDGGALMPVYLSLKNPMIHDARRAPWDDVRGTQWQLGRSKDPWTIRELAETARAEGHDGLIVRNTRDRAGFRSVLRQEWQDFKDFIRPHDVIVAFEPTQIKSAIGNEGVFDPADPSIIKHEWTIDDDVASAHLETDALGDTHPQEVITHEMQALAPVHPARGDEGIAMVDKRGRETEDPAEAIAIRMGSNALGTSSGETTTHEEVVRHYRAMIDAGAKIAAARHGSEKLTEALGGAAFNHWMLRYIVDEEQPGISQKVLEALPKAQAASIEAMRKATQGSQIGSILSSVIGIDYQTKLAISNWVRTTNQRDNNMIGAILSRLRGQGSKRAADEFEGAANAYLRAHSTTMATIHAGLPRMETVDGIRQNVSEGRSAPLLDIVRGLNPETRIALNDYVGDRGKRGEGRTQFEIDRIHRQVIALQETLGRLQAGGTRHAMEIMQVMSQIEEVSEPLGRLEERLEEFQAFQEEVMQRHGVDQGALREAHRRLRVFLDDHLNEYMVASGVTNLQDMQAERTADPEWVPQRRPQYGGGSSVSDYTGSATGAVDFMESILGLVQFVARQAELNTMLLNIAEIDDGTVVPVGRKAVSDATGEPDMRRPIAVASADARGDKAALEGQVFFRTQELKHEAVEQEDGSIQMVPYTDVRHHSVRDPHLVDFLNYMSAGTGANPHVVRMLAIPGNIFRTSLSLWPNFQLLQIAKDTAEGQVTSSDQRGRPLVPALISAFRRAAEANVTHRFSDETYLAMVNGGYSSARDLSSLLTEGAAADRSLSGHMAKWIPGSRIPQLVKRSGGIWEAMLGMAHFSDQAMRIAAARSERKAGKSPRQEAVTSQNIHNFSLHGTGAFMTYTRALVPYLQSYIRGVSRLGEVAVETWKEDLPKAMQGDAQAATRIGRKVGLIAVGAAALAAWDDWLEEAEPLYAMIDPETKARPGFPFFLPNEAGRLWMKENGVTEIPSDMAASQRAKLMDMYFVPFGHDTGNIAKAVSLGIRKAVNGGDDQVAKEAWATLRDVFTPPHSVPPVTLVQNAIGDSNVRYANRGLDPDDQVAPNTVSGSVGRAMNVSPDKVNAAFEAMMPGLAATAMVLMDDLAGKRKKDLGTAMLPSFIRSDRLNSQQAREYWQGYGAESLQKVDDTYFRRMKDRVANGESVDEIRAEDPEFFQRAMLGKMNGDPMWKQGGRSGPSVSGLMRKNSELMNMVSSRMGGEPTLEEMHHMTEALAMRAYTMLDGEERLAGRWEGEKPGYENSGIATQMKELAATTGSERVRANAYRTAAAELATLIRRGNYALYVAWRKKALERMEAK